MTKHPSSKYPNPKETANGNDELPAGPACGTSRRPWDLGFGCLPFGHSLGFGYLGLGYLPPGAVARRRAFTLVELLIVITIIAMLAAMVLAVSTKLRDKARRDRTRMILEKIDTALEMYRDTYENWPEAKTSTGGVGFPDDLTNNGGSDLRRNEVANRALAQALILVDASIISKGSGGVVEIVGQDGGPYDKTDPKNDEPHVIDVWGNPIRVVQWGTAPPNEPKCYNYPGPDIWSMGPDGATYYRVNEDGDGQIDEDGAVAPGAGVDPGWQETDDDVVNWRRD